MKDAECAESRVKSNFRFLRFLFCMQNTEETFAKYAVDANLFRLGSTNPKNKNPVPGFFWGLLYRGLILAGLLSG